MSSICRKFQIKTKRIFQRELTDNFMASAPWRVKLHGNSLNLPLSYLCNCSEVKECLARPQEESQLLSPCPLVNLLAGLHCKLFLSCEMAVYVADVRGAFVCLRHLGHRSGTHFRALAFHSRCFTCPVCPWSPPVTAKTWQSHNKCVSLRKSGSRDDNGVEKGNNLYHESLGLLHIYIS